jgi:hypothetical protein
MIFNFFTFEQFLLLNLFRIKIYSNLNFIQIRILLVFQILNKFEICSYLKIV